MFLAIHAKPQSFVKLAFHKHTNITILLPSCKYHPKICLSKQGLIDLNTKTEYVPKCTQTHVNCP